MPAMWCEVCGAKGVRKSHRVESGQPFVCAKCRASTPPNEWQCTAFGKNKQRCKAWARWEKSTCAHHKGYWGAR